MQERKIGWNNTAAQRKRLTPRKKSSGGATSLIFIASEADAVITFVMLSQTCKIMAVRLRHGIGVQFLADVNAAFMLSGVSRDSVTAERRLLFPSIPVRNGPLSAGIVEKLCELRTVQSCHYLNPAVSAGMYEVQSPGDQASRDSTPAS